MFLIEKAFVCDYHNNLLHGQFSNMEYTLCMYDFIIDA